MKSVFLVMSMFLSVVALGQVRAINVRKREICVPELVLMRYFKVKGRLTEIEAEIPTNVDYLAVRFPDKCKDLRRGIVSSYNIIIGTDTIRREQGNVTLERTKLMQLKAGECFEIWQVTYYFTDEVTEAEHSARVIDGMKYCVELER